ncbi:MAG TPA: outer membrane protein transport protein [Hyphomicrobium sp.]|nr:outer membrane protein transport protein [Hyphomicrobium sp.]
MQAHSIMGLAALAALALLAAASEALAGGFGVEQSAYYQGMSYAGAAAGGESLTSLAWNPATAAFAGNGLSLESSYSVVLLSANLTVTNPQDQPTTGPAETQMGRDALVGASFVTWRLDSKTVVGVSLTAPFGLGTKAENTDWVGSFEGVTTSLFNLNAAPIISYEVAPGLNVAVGLQIDYFDLQRQTADTPIGAANLRADDTGVGAVAGIDYAPTRDTSIGLGYRSAVHHTLNGHITLYGVDEAPIKATVILPEMVSLGVRHAVSPTTRLMAEAEWVHWSRLGVIPVELQGPFLGLPAGATAANLDFRWRDGWLFALGGEYDWSRALTLRTGVGYEISPVGSATERLVQDPDSNRVWASLGASYKWSADTRFDFSYSHVFYEDNAPFDRVGASFPTPHLLGTADVSMDVISVGYKYVWGGAPAPVALK